jgi:hypothetical protein
MEKFFLQEPLKLFNNTSCLVVVKEAKSRESQRLVPTGPDFNSPLVVSIECTAKAHAEHVVAGAPVY